MYILNFSRIQNSEKFFLKKKKQTNKQNVRATLKMNRELNITQGVWYAR